MSNDLTPYLESQFPGIDITYPGDDSLGDDTFCRRVRVHFLMDTALQSFILRWALLITLKSESYGKGHSSTRIRSVLIQLGFKQRLNSKLSFKPFMI